MVYLLTSTNFAFYHSEGGTSQIVKFYMRMHATKHIAVLQDQWHPGRGGGEPCSLAQSCEGAPEKRKGC